MAQSTKPVRLVVDNGSAYFTTRTGNKTDLNELKTKQITYFDIEDNVESVKNHLAIEYGIMGSRKHHNVYAIC